MAVQTKGEAMKRDSVRPSWTSRLQTFDWLWADTRAKVALSWILAMLFVAIFAPILAPVDPIATDFRSILVSPSTDYLLGTDDLGRDYFSRMLYGARVSMFGAFLAVAVSMAIGVPVGLTAGYVGGTTDNVLMRIADSILGFPAIVLAIGLVAALGPGLTNAMVAIGVVFSPSVARLMRGQVALAFLAEAALSFLGLGAQPPTASWGGMLSRSSQFLHVSPSIQLYAPGMAIALTVLAINALGDSLRDSLDPVMGTERRLRRTLAKAAKSLDSNDSDVAIPPDVHSASAGPVQS
jgi:peptide/nickel transport system permease protein